jgi:hypothetical protein
VRPRRPVRFLADGAAIPSLKSATDGDWWDSRVVRTSGSLVALLTVPHDRTCVLTARWLLAGQSIDFLPIAGDPSSMSDDMTAAGRGPEHPPEVDWTAAMPVGHQNPYTPVGEIEQIGKFASGVNRQIGWRRLTGRILVLVILLSIIVGIIAVIVH